MKKRFILMMGILLVFYIPTIFSYFMILNNGPIGSYNTEYSTFSESNRRFKSASFHRHDPILIKSNSEFNETNGVTGGMGTQSNPYIIEEWMIFSEGEGSGIEITNTTAFFLIKRCSVWTSKEGRYYAGIKLVNVTNGRLEENNAYQNGWSGIYINNSRQIDLSNNNGWDNLLAGINVRNSADITIRSNNLSNNGYYGIVIAYSSNITVIDNTCVNNNQGGIELYRSHNNLVVRNTVLNNYIGIELFDTTNSNISQTYSQGNYNGISVYGGSNNNQITDNHAYWNLNSIKIGNDLENFVSNNTIFAENPPYFQLFSAFRQLSEIITIPIVIYSIYYWFSKKIQLRRKMKKKLNEKELLSEHKEIMQKAHGD